MDLNAPLLEALARWLRLGSPSMLSYPPGHCGWILLEWTVLMLEAYVFLGLLWMGFRAVRKGPAPAAPTKASPLRAVLQALGACLIFLGVLEGAVRGYVSAQPVPNYLPDPLLMWRFRPNLRDFPLPTPVGTMYLDTNAEGLRDRDVPAEKAPHEVRIVVLGDSATFGQSIAADKVYAHQLEILLARQYPQKQIRVINGGVPGYSILQGYFLMKQVCLNYHPDLVVVNEFNEFSNRQVGEFDTVVPRNVVARHLKQWLWSSMVYMTVRKMAARFTHPGPPPPQEMRGPERPIQSDADVMEYMARFYDLFRRYRIRAIFCTWRRPGYWTPAWRRILQGADPSRWVAVDYNPFLLQEHGAVFWLKNDPSHHPSVAGHRLMAEALRNTIVQNHMLDL